jgi:hypothetical protein
MKGPLRPKKDFPESFFDYWKKSFAHPEDTD